MRFSVFFPTVILTPHFLAVAAQAAIPNLFQTYEDAAEPEYAVGSGGVFQIKLSAGSRVSFDEARFGRGSLLVNPLAEGNNSLAWQTLIRSPELAAFQAELRRFTVTAWVRPSGSEPFVIFWRIPSDLGRPGFFQFTFLGGRSKRLYFAATNSEEGAGGQFLRHELTSKENILVLPGEWNHFAMTFDEGAVQFYFNGEPVGEPRSLPIEVIPQAASNFPSMKAVAGAGAGSRVDDFGVFGDRALAGKDIRSIYENGLEAFLKISLPQVTHNLHKP